MRLQPTPLNLPSTGAALYFPSGQHHLTARCRPPRSVRPTDLEGLTAPTRGGLLQEVWRPCLRMWCKNAPPPRASEGKDDIYRRQTLTAVTTGCRLSREADVGLHVETLGLIYQQHDSSSCFPRHVNEVGFTVALELLGTLKVKV